MSNPNLDFFILFRFFFFLSFYSSHIKQHLVRFYFFSFRHTNKRTKPNTTNNILGISIIEWPDILFSQSKKAINRRNYNDNNEDEGEESTRSSNNISGGGDDDDDNDDSNADDGGSGGTTLKLPNPLHRLDITMTIGTSTSSSSPSATTTTTNTDAATTSTDDADAPRYVTLSVPQIVLQSTTTTTTASSQSVEESSSSPSMSSTSTWIDRIQFLIDEGLVDDWMD